MRVLLISNSGSPFLEHCRAAMARFLEGRPLHFVAAATYGDEATYTEAVRTALAPVGIAVQPLPLEAGPAREILEGAAAVFVGGGNTYHLLGRLHAAGLVEPLRERVRAGMPYIGSSAGSNLAGPNILTTNDWNVDGIMRFDALGLVAFNINPHYQPVDPTAAPCSETRDERIEQYRILHDNPVAGIEEQTWVEVNVTPQERVARVGGQGSVRWFEPGRRPVDIPAGGCLPDTAFVDVHGP